ncbi:MAG: O-antigen ligase family protein [Caldilineaceae bacterium]
MAALFLFWPLRLTATRRLAPATPLNWPIFLLLLWSPVGVWASQYPDRSWEALGYLVLGIALYFAFLNWPLTQRYPLLIVAGLGLVGLALATTGPALLANIPEKLFTFSDDFAKSKPIELFGLGETINSNVLAGTLLLPICLLTALILQPRWLKRGPARWWAPLLLSLATISIMATLFLTQSRGAYLALAIGLLLVFVLRWPRIGIAVAVAGIAALVVLVSDGLLETLNSDSAITTTSGRVEVWQRALYTLRDFPLTGLGIGAFGLVIPQLYPYEHISNQPDVIPHAHNLFLQVGVDLGVPGLLLYLWLWISTLANLIMILRKHGNFDQDEEDLDEIKDSHLRHRLKRQLHRNVKLRWALAVGLLATFVSLFIHGLVDAIAWGTKVAFLPWLLFALTALLIEQQPTSPIVEMAVETSVSDFKLIGQEQ